MNKFRTRRFGQPLAILASGMVIAGLGATLYVPVALADSSGSSSASTTQSASPYAVLGTVTSNPATINFDNLYTLVGKTVKWNASGLPSNTTLNLVWETYSGQWDTQAEHFIGAHYATGNKVIAHVTTDSSGNASGSVVAPSGFGDAHMVGLVDNQGNVVAAGTITLAPVATIESKTAAQGQFFHIHVDGLGVGKYTSVYEVLYDNRLLGNISGVTTNGQADFTVRAEGGVGPHTIQLIVGGVEGPYLNAKQSPFSYRPNYSFVVNVTPGHPTTVSDPLPKATPSTGHHLTASVGSGVVGDKFTLSGSGLTPNHTYQLVWNTMAGSRVSGKGYQTKQISLGSVTTDASGSFTKAETVPDDLGGPAHTIQVLDGSTVAGDTTFRIYPKLVSAPKTVTIGQHFDVNLQGVGWTEYDNTYAVTYDNSTIGYVCGFNSHGDVSVQLQASGKPGIHYIDLYPSVYKGQQPLPYLYGIPLLTYANDHPGDDLPAIHVVVDVLAANQMALKVNGSTKETISTSTVDGQTYVPLYNVMKTLEGLGATSQWNGHTWRITSADAQKVQGSSGTASGDMTVVVNNQTLLNAPSQVETVSGSRVKTTYVPIHAVNQVLQALGMTGSVSGSTWSWTK